MDFVIALGFGQKYSEGNLAGCAELGGCNQSITGRTVLRHKILHLLGKRCVKDPISYTQCIFFPGYYIFNPPKVKTVLITVAGSEAVIRLLGGTS